MHKLLPERIVRMNSLQSKIAAINAYVPSESIPNALFEEKFNLPVGSIFAKTGLSARRYSSQNEHPIDMGIKAALLTLDEAKVVPQEIDMIISASACKNQPVPTDAMSYAGALGIPAVQTCHMEVVCLSFVQALEIADLYIKSGKHQKILIISSEKCSKYLDPNDPSATIVLADGAAAALVMPNNGESCIEASCMFTIASDNNLNCAYIKGGGTKYYPLDDNFNSEWAYFYIDGGMQIKLAIKHFPVLLKELFKQANCSFCDIDYVIPHQVIPSMIRRIVQHLGFPLEKVYINDFYGNQAAASIPIGFAELIKQNKIKRGDRILLIGGAAGFSVGGTIIRY